jgi:hypothetical protein
MERKSILGKGWLVRSELLVWNLNREEKLIQGSKLFLTCLREVQEPLLT